MANSHNVHLLFSTLAADLTSQLRAKYDVTRSTADLVRLGEAKLEPLGSSLYDHLKEEMDTP